MQLFVSRYLDGRYHVYGGLENLTQQLYLLVRKDGPLTGAQLFQPSTDYLTAPWFFDVDGDRCALCGIHVCVADARLYSEHFTITRYVHTYLVLCRAFCCCSSYVRGSSRDALWLCALPSRALAITCTSSCCTSRASTSPRASACGQVDEWFDRGPCVLVCVCRVGLTRFCAMAQEEIDAYVNKSIAARRRIAAECLRYVNGRTCVVCVCVCV